MQIDRSGLADGVVIGGATFERHAFDALNRTTVEENDFARVEVDRDSLGNAATEIQRLTVPGVGGDALRLERTHDDGGALTGVRHPEGRELAFDRDPSGRLIRVRNVANGGRYPGAPATPEAYELAAFGHAGSQPTSARYGNGTTTGVSLDGAGRVVEIDHRDGTGRLLTIQCLHDSVGNVRHRHENAGASAERIAYDSLYRLVDAREQAAIAFDARALAPPAAPLPEPIPATGRAAIDGLLGSQAMPPEGRTFDYDLAGNRQRERPGAGPIPAIDYVVNAADQYLRRGDAELRYDRNGNLATDGERRYTYDAHDRLVRVLDAATGDELAAFFHDAGGRRVVETAAGRTSRLLHDGLRTVAEYRDGRPFAQYAHDDGADRPLQIAAEGGEHWFHADTLGSVRLLTDANGAPAAAYRFAPFGATVADSGGPYNPVRFSGRRLDSALGTYDHRARQYDPVSGRFLQRDPAGARDDSNLYAYTRNNPLRFTDRLGLAREERVAPGATGAGALLGAVDAAAEFLDPIADALGGVASAVGLGGAVVGQRQLRLERVLTGRKTPADPSSALCGSDGRRVRPSASWRCARASTTRTSRTTRPSSRCPKRCALASPR